MCSANTISSAKLAREMLLWAGLNHPNIVPFIGYWLSLDEDTVYIVSQYAAFGNIREYLKNTEATEMEKLKLVCFASFSFISLF